MVSQKLFPELRGWDIFLGLSETHGHLEVLKDEGLISSLKVGDQRFYRLVYWLLNWYLVNVPRHF